MLYYQTKFKIIQDCDDLVYNLSLIGYYWNPSLVPFQGGYLMSARLYLGQHINFFWLDSDYKLNNNITHRLNPYDVKIPGGDARVILINDSTIYIACTGELSPSRMKIAQVTFHNYSNATVHYINNVIPFEGYGSHVFHKNWVPFKFNNSILLAQYIDPLEIVEVITIPNISFSNIQAISKSLKTDIVWKYGDIRGGTGAKLLGDDKYLAFFHSRVRLYCNPLITYFFGAYLFSSTNPFRVTMISRVPIYHPQFYNGPWGNIRHFDYVVYPMDFFYDKDLMEITGFCNITNDCYKNHNITLSMGLQDGQGWVANINLYELMLTLKPVNIKL